MWASRGESRAPLLYVLPIGGFFFCLILWLFQLLYRLSSPRALESVYSSDSRGSSRPMCQPRAFHLFMDWFFFVYCIRIVLKTVFGFTFLPVGFCFCGWQLKVQIILSLLHYVWLLSYHCLINIKLFLSLQIVVCTDFLRHRFSFVFISVWVNCN